MQSILDLVFQFPLPPQNKKRNSINSSKGEQGLLGGICQLPEHHLRQFGTAEDDDMSHVEGSTMEGASLKRVCVLCGDGDVLGFCAPVGR
jgi:hypothetical protein